MKIFKSFKSCFSVFLVLVLLLGYAPQAFAASTDAAYGFWVPIKNDNALWVGSNGTSNKNQIDSMSDYLRYKSTNAEYAYYNKVIFVKPGDVSLAMSVAKYISKNSYDTTISNARYWTYKTLSGSCSAKTSSYTYWNDRTWYKVNIPDMQSGDLVQITSSKMTGYIFCGSPSDLALTDFDIN